MPETGAVTIPAEILPTLPHLGLSLHRERGLRNAPGEVSFALNAGGSKPSSEIMPSPQLWSMLRFGA